jgi:hypothetical protein
MAGLLPKNPPHIRSRVISPRRFGFTLQIQGMLGVGLRYLKLLSKGLLYLFSEAEG